MTEKTSVFCLFLPLCYVRTLNDGTTSNSDLWPFFFWFEALTDFMSQLSLAALRLPVQCLSNGGGIRKRLKRFCPLVNANFKLRQAVLKSSSNEKCFTSCVGLEGKDQNNLKLKIKIKMKDLFVHFLTCFKKSYCEKCTFFQLFIIRQAGFFLYCSDTGCSDFVWHFVKVCMASLSPHPERYYQSSPLADTVVAGGGWGDKTASSGGVRETLVLWSLYSLN